MNPVVSGERSEPSLRRVIGRSQFFTLAFGTIIGSAWLVVLNDWLETATPAGAILAFVAGGATMTLMAAMYAELSARMPEAGGEFIYASRIFGAGVGFAVGWLLLLYLVAVAAFEAIALGWMVQVAVPASRGANLYNLLGGSITSGGLLLGTGGLVLVTYVNVRGVHVAVQVQRIVTFMFIAVAVSLLCTAAAKGHVENLSPFVGDPGGRSTWWKGSLLIFSNSAFFLTGFQAIPQAIEERERGMTMMTSGRIMVLSVVGATMFYCLAIICSCLAAPWRTLAHTPLAPAEAVREALGNSVAPKILVLAAALSLLKTWNAVVLMAARLLMALGRSAMMPPALGRIHRRYATPSVAVYFVSAWTLAGIMLGTGAVLPLVNTSSICLAVTFVVSCLALLKIRRRNGHRSEFSAFGGNVAVLMIAMCAIAMALIALLAPLTRANGSVPLEWLLLAVWFVVGLAVFAFGKARRSAQ